jgi:APA family basic amino acid/polyamine antiporter
MEEKRPVTTMGWLKVLVPASLAFIFSILAIIGAGEDIVFWGFVLLLSGTPLYVWNQWNRSLKNKNQP